MSIRTILLAAASVVCMAALGQKSITAQECWLDGNFAARQPATATVDISGLAVGLHSYSVRVQDSEGLWSSAITKYFVIPSSVQPATSITACEYWLDGDIATRTTIGASPAPIDIADLAIGLHTFTIRAQDNNGVWSSPITKYFIKEKVVEPTTIARYMYWFDDDETNRVIGELTEASGVLPITLPGTLADGTHTLSWCVGDSKGVWSNVRAETFNYIDPYVLQQDEEGNYLLSTVKDWQKFAELVNGGNTTADARMTADIDLGNDQTMIGTLSVPYEGTFDGQGHTLTVNYNQSGVKDGIGPFYVIGAATIQNLHVDGNMVTNCAIGGIAGIVKGNATIQRCWVSATMQAIGSSLTGTIGGICSVLEGVDDAHLTIEDCLFDGVIVNNQFCGGFMSHVERASCSVTMRRGLNIGTYPNTIYENGTFIREVLNGVRNLEASTLFHKKVFGSAQGTQVTDEQLASGSIAYKLQANRTDLVWGQRLGTDAEPVLTNDESYRVYKSKNGGYTNDPEDAYMGLQQDGEGNYLLSNLLDWQEFAELVKTTPTANAKMTADIDLGNDQTMIGSNNTYPYSGIFDGQGHTLTVAYNNTDAGLYVAPFSYIYGATIRNLHVAGTIQTTCQNAGVVSKYGGSGNVVENVWSSLAIQTNWTVNGGIWECCSGLIGSTLAGTNASLIMRDCLFTGFVVATSGDQSGCFMGYVDTGCSANVSNCLSVGTYSYTATNSSVTRDRMSIDNSFVKQFPNAIPAAMQLTSERLADGSIAYKLQDKRADLVWGQRIGIDPEPVLTNDESYRVYISKNGGYTNNPEDAFMQDEEGYYLLGSVQDWKAFAALINSGITTANAKMTADINLGDDQTMIGLGSVDGQHGDGNLLYTGIFDGQGHTLTINYVTNERFVAPFRHIQDATIKNLRVAGTITTNNQFAAGIVGACYGQNRDNYITNCISSVNIVSSWENTADTYLGGSLIGGIIGKLCYYNRLHISDCIFNGSISGENRTVAWGGFVGLPDGRIIVRNSLLTAEFNCTNVLVGSNGSGTFSSVFGGGYASTIDIDASNYYLNALGSVQGTQANVNQLADGTTTNALQAGREEEIWVQVGTSTPMLKLFAPECNIPLTEIEEIACDSFPWHGTMYYATEDITKTFQAVNGCDSVVTLHLTITNTPPPTVWENGVLPGKFSINANGDQVFFSQGNLKYFCSTTAPEWRFAEHQYDYVPFDISAYAENSEKWIDLFAYGTSGYDNGQTNYQPYVVGANPNTYYQGDLTGNADWGYNAISNGGNTENFGWRTLTKDEWIYLFSGRTDAAYRYGHGSINGVHGMILIPDEWTTPDGLYFNPGNTIWMNSYTIEQWSLMEEAGAVFLPASGSCNNVGIPSESLQNENGFYRASTPQYYLHFAHSNVNNCTIISSHYGDAVRLVQAAQEETPTGVESIQPSEGSNLIQKILRNGQLFILRGDKIYNVVGTVLSTFD